MDSPVPKTFSNQQPGTCKTIAETCLTFNHSLQPLESNITNHKIAHREPPHILPLLHLHTPKRHTSPNPPKRNAPLQLMPVTNQHLPFLENLRQLHHHNAQHGVMLMLARVFDYESENGFLPVADEELSRCRPDGGGVVVLHPRLEAGEVVAVDVDVRGGVEAVFVFGAEDEIEGLVELEGEDAGF